MRLGISKAAVIFAGVSLAVFGAIGLLTSHALRLEREERSARLQAKQQEAIRLALWRMDAALAPIVARESARPYFEYHSFYPADRAYTRMFQEVKSGEVLVASPLLTTGQRFVKLHFQVGPDGALTSPQSPSGNMRDLAETMFVSSQQVMEGERQLERLSGLLGLNKGQVAPGAPGSRIAGREMGQAQDQYQEAERSRSQVASGPVQQQTLEQSEAEYQYRQQTAALSRNIVEQQWKQGANEPPADPSKAATQGRGGGSTPPPTNERAPAPATTPAVSGVPPATEKDKSSESTLKKETQTGAGFQRDGAPANPNPPPASEPPPPSAGASVAPSAKPESAAKRAAPAAVGAAPVEKRKPNEEVRREDKATKDVGTKDADETTARKAEDTKTRVTGAAAAGLAVPGATTGDAAALNEATTRTESLGLVAPDLGVKFDALAPGLPRDVPPDVRIGANAAPIEQGEFTPMWLSDASGASSKGEWGGEIELVLLRTVRLDGKQVAQGVWLDWPSLRDWLTSLVKDLLPGATLRPVVQGAPGVPGQTGVQGPEALACRLASVPADIVPVIADMTAVGGGGVGSIGITPLRTVLVVAWLVAVAAVVVAGLVLRASMELAERRGRFVSAVTHELRTPLTTFCLYSQMLADGMVKEEPARVEYLSTLKREAQRLARIVENVLEYARLSRRKAVGARDHLTVAGLFGRIVPAVKERAGQCGMEIVVEADGLDSIEMDTDAQTIERVVTNLVDNACKYARGGDGEPGSTGGPVQERRIDLAARIDGQRLEIAVRDYGPGIRPEDQARIFDPFYRGKGNSEMRSSGLGLGLSLSKGLAEQLGGDLRLDSRTRPGARFVLTVPLRKSGAGR